MKRSRVPIRFACLLTLLALLPTTAHAADADPSLPERAFAVLKAHCAACHSHTGKAKGGLDYVLDRERLISRQQVMPGKAADSPLYQRIQQGEMPPAKRPRVPAAELALLQRWIDAGAPAPAGTTPHIPVTVAAVPRLILADLQGLEPRQRRFMRYFTLTHLAAARVAPEALQQHRQALAKLANSLSWHPRIAPPHAIDEVKTIYRLDMRDYRWTARLWDRLTRDYPYHLNDQNETGRQLTALAGSEVPYVRGDWFVATASRPPFYHDFLQLPNSERSLERLLGVDVVANLQEDNAVRAGFNGSGVARSNRIIERHDANHGAYWRSYDFSDNIGRQNIFENPLGPSGSGFNHAGGELIFNLPNGLQGYMLVDGRGGRVDRAPGEIVSDPKRPDRLVEAGLSCMSCHNRGLLPKDDQVRPHVLKNPAAFNPADRAAIKALYVPAARFKTLMAEDRERFAKALEKMGVPAGEPEPVEVVTLRYEGVLDLTTAAAEAGLAPNDFAERLRRAPALARPLGALLARGGTVQRQLFQESYADLVKALYPDGGSSANPTEVAAIPFAGHTGSVRGLALSWDGRLTATGGEDRTVRVWDVTTGKERLRLEGHAEEVTAVAFSGDGKRVLSGGRDRTLRLWDVDGGREVLRLRGHTDGVLCVALAADGKRALSGGEDRTVRLWDLSNGRELQAWALGGAVTTVALAPDGKLALAGGRDGSLRLWDTATGQGQGRWEGHHGAVYSVAFAPDGKLALSGGNDRLVRLWDVATGKERQHFSGHANAVVCVRFSPDGRHALSASSQYQTQDKILRVWDVEKGKELRALGLDAEERVEAVAFARDGSQALLSQSAGKVRLLALPKSP